MSDQSFYKQAGIPASLKTQQTGTVSTIIYSRFSEHHLSTSILSNITRLSPNDIALFREAFQQEEIPCYADSWLYLLRFTRTDEGGWGYKFVGDGTLIGIGYRKGTLYLVHPMGPGRFEMTQRLVTALRVSFQGPILLKKVDHALYQHLCATVLFHACPENSILIEEEAYPEHILPLPLLYGEGGQYHRSSSFTRKVKQFDRQESIQLTAITDFTDIEQRLGFQELFASHEDKHPSYVQMIRESSKRSSSIDAYNICAYVDQTSVIHGLYLSERLRDQYWGLYCAISSRAARGITEWMDHDFFRRLFQSECEALYLGGSETQGVHDYVQKLFPSQPSYCMLPLQAAE